MMVDLEIGYSDVRAKQPRRGAVFAKPMAGLLTQEDDSGKTRDSSDDLPTFRGPEGATVTLPDAMDMTPGMDCAGHKATRSGLHSNAIPERKTHCQLYWQNKRFP